jgi:phenylacetate-coenzyme A ligase PaaK-like adenylate-forming protein
MSARDELFSTGDSRGIWQKYCGFLDLKLKEFMGIQEDFLLEELELVSDTAIGSTIMKGRKPSTIEEFLKVVPFTTYDDYKDFFLDKKDDALCEKAHMWIRTSGRTGAGKWVPYTERAWEKTVDYGIATVILACASRRGHVNVKSGHRILHNVAPRPYLSGFMIHSVFERTGWQLIPPADTFEELTFQERIGVGFQIALKTGIDLVESLASVLVKIGEGFADRSRSRKGKVSHPAVIMRLLRALIQSKLENRAMLPKDLWKLKGIMVMGTDAAIYKDKIKYYWGVVPAEFYAATEPGFLATQVWNKKSLTFVPDCCFLEFIPEEEWQKNKEDRDYVPKTVLYDQVEAGKIYELVVTTFYGVPFLRYRIGDLIKVVALKDEEAGIDLPQIEFYSRADDLIDIANFTRLDERTIWIAISHTGIKYEEWTLRKEYVQDDVVLHLYIEIKDEHNASEIEEMVHQQLRLISEDYNSMAEMMEINPIKVTLLSLGTFMKYMEVKQAAGVDPGWLKPAHINASDEVIAEISDISQRVS